MMESQYKKCVLSLKNGFGRDMCVIAEQEGIDTALLIKNDGQTPVYIYRKDGKYEKGQQNNEKYMFFMTSIDDICAVIYGNFDEVGKPVKAAFTGFLSEKCEIKPFSEGKKEENIDKNEKTDKEEIKEEKEKIKQTKIDLAEENKIKYAPVIEEYEKIKKTNSAQNNFKHIIEVFSKEMQKFEENKVFEENDIKYIFKDKNDEKEEKLFESRKKIEPFSDSVYDWVMVSMADMWQTKISNCKCVMNVMVMLSEIKYHHLALGRNRETGNYIFAVPEKFSENDSKLAKSLGFKDFWFCDREKSHFGYWVMDIK